MSSFVDKNSEKTGDEKEFNSKRMKLIESLIKKEENIDEIYCIRIYFVEKKNILNLLQTRAS